MEDINLHFTGDFAAIASAHNLLAALLDNHVHHGNELGLDLRRITWKRVLDMNDRALRHIAVGLGGPANGFPREDGFDIVVASEVMAIFCLAESLADLKERLGAIIVGRTRERKPVRARDLGAGGAMAALLRDAIKPNLVQTLENNPAIIHGGPFGNIAHGCNSVIATRTALRLGDIVVTEAGFGADLGAEKFIDIKCRKSGLRPEGAVVVATVRALKYHGGMALADLRSENLAALEAGFANLQRHLHNVRVNYGLPCVVGLNHFVSDTPAELELLQRLVAGVGVRLVVARHWAEGGAGAEELARAVLDAMERTPARLHFIYDDAEPLWGKIERIATTIYAAAGADADDSVRTKLREFEDEGFGHLPVCIAKTPYSFSSDPTKVGAATGHRLQVRDVRLNAGAQFIVAICGDVMTMPGLPRVPSAARIDVTDDGRITGLF
jgi:formate--tetrahydrofolate ligase